MSSNTIVTPPLPPSTTASPQRSEGLTWWRRKSTRRQIAGWFGLLAILLGAIIMLTPLLWMLSTSLKAEGDIFVIPVQWIPKQILWSNYPAALTYVPYFRYFLNSVEVSILVVIGAVLSASCVAFAFARLRAPGKDTLFVILLATLMLPGEVTLVPVYLLFRIFGWLDTYQPLILPSWFGGSAFYIFLLRQFFLTLPTELDDAAKIDGASLFDIYWRIVMPLSKPALATIAIFAFFGSWNAFQAPLIYLNTMEKYTLPIALRLYLSTLGNTHWNFLMAATLVSIIPPLVIFFTSQRYFVEGAVLTGIKG
ncbi:MAG: carbohydrate ABC transporter permease [Chloroflexi bacterium]|nr:carbohydrate ABC transporter permease [Chloroflexota bacterium]